MFSLVPFEHFTLLSFYTLQHKSSLEITTDQIESGLKNLIDSTRLSSVRPSQRLDAKKKHL